jgi:hypothetical protein
MSSTTYLGQIRYNRDERWVTVSEAATLREAARHAAEAFACDDDPGRRARAVRVVASDRAPLSLNAGLLPG